MYSRIVRCRKIAMNFALYYEIFMALVYFIAAPYITGYFTQDPKVAEIMTAYLRIIPWGFGLMEIHRYCGFFFTGCNYPHGSAWLAVLRIIVLLIPLSLLAGFIGWALVVRMTGKLPGDGEMILRS